MPIERYRVGRSSTVRERVTVSVESLGTEEGTEGIEALKAGFEEAGRRTSLAYRIRGLIRWAEKTLRGANLPPNTFSDPIWKRENEYRSAEWYSHAIIEAARWLKHCLRRGDAQQSAHAALTLGMLGAEAKFIFGYMEPKAREARRQGRETPEQHESRANRAQRKDCWLDEAAALRERHPDWSDNAIARRIAPEQVRTARRVLGEHRRKLATD